MSNTVNVTFKTSKGRSNVSVPTLLFELLELSTDKATARALLRDWAVAEAKAGTRNISKSVQQTAMLFLMQAGRELGQAEAVAQLGEVGELLVNLADAMSMLTLPDDLDPAHHTQH